VDGRLHLTGIQRLEPSLQLFSKTCKVPTQELADRNLAATVFTRS
jgi:hypothetical protein